MKKYEVPVMKLHKLKTSCILSGSAKGRYDNSGVNTQSYEYDKDFDADNLFDE